MENKTNKILNYGLIGTFSILYLATAFVSFYHAIEFFNLSNDRWLSVILSLVAEIGQATVLFSLLMTKNKNKIMPWFIMIVLTALQVIGNVYSCYVYIEMANSNKFEFFQKSILFFLDESHESMKVIVAWITGSLLPIIALCLTSLVATSLLDSDKTEDEDEDEEDDGENEQTLLNDTYNAFGDNTSTEIVNNTDEYTQNTSKHIDGEEIYNQNNSNNKIIKKVISNKLRQQDEPNELETMVNIENIETK